MIAPASSSPSQIDGGQAEPNRIQTKPLQALFGNLDREDERPVVAQNRIDRIVVQEIPGIVQDDAPLKPFDGLKIMRGMAMHDVDTALDHGLLVVPQSGK